MLTFQIPVLGNLKSQKEDKEIWAVRGEEKMMEHRGAGMRGRERKPVGGG